MKEIKYRDFMLKEKEYYIIKINESPFYNNSDTAGTYGVAQLTRIDLYDEDSPRSYWVLHFKHNKAEYLQYQYCLQGTDKYNSRCVVIRPHTAEFGFAYRNSRIKVTADNQYYFPEGYNPGGHSEKG